MRIELAENSEVNSAAKQYRHRYVIARCVCAFLCRSSYSPFILLKYPCSNYLEFSLEVFEVVYEGRALEAVGDGASSLHAVRHARWTAGEHANVRQQEVLLLEAVEELVKVRTTKVGDGAQTSEETASRQFLEVPLTDVLREQKNCKLRVYC